MYTCQQARELTNELTILSPHVGTKWEMMEQIRADIRDFRTAKKLDKVWRREDEGLLSRSFIVFALFLSLHSVTCGMKNGNEVEFSTLYRADVSGLSHSCLHITNHG